MAGKRKERALKEIEKVEAYIPLDKEDLKHALEVPVKQIDESKLETVEYIGKKKSKKRAVKAKTSKRKITKKNSSKTTKVLKITPKKGGYILLITEKPQAANKIAYALADKGLQKFAKSGVPYYELEHQGQKIIVVCAVGHLFTLSQKEGNKSEFPVFNIEWKPNFEVRKKDFTKKYYAVIKSLCKDAGKYIVATDYDVEGEVIGFNVIKHLCGQEDAERMKFSTLTASEIKDAYDKRHKTIDWGQAIAGETRHFLDWFYGINLSRALMSAIKSTGSFRIMSIGRVQGPALHIIVDKEKQIQAFKPEPYWQIFINVKGLEKPYENVEVELKYNKDLSLKEKNKLKEFEKLKNQETDVKTEKYEQELFPLPPFDLTSLQMEAYKFFNINPARTLQIAQQLYLNGLISYPRTSSQKLPPSINYKKILGRVNSKFNFEKFIKRAVPVQGKKSDPAHPAIYPTGEFAVLNSDEKKIYELIVKRFIACFCNSAILYNKKISTEIDKLRFSAKGMSIKEKGWLNVYPAKLTEKELPDLEGKSKITKVRTEEKITQPPRRYTPASLISELEKKNLGTKATRSSIVETLYDRGYVKGQSIEATPLGISLIETLEKNSPVIIDEKLTRHFEQEMEKIRQEKQEKIKKHKEEVINEAKEAIIKISKDFKKHEKAIGGDLVKATNNLWAQERADAEIGECPVCKKGNLRIIYNRKFKRSFVGCSNYPECKATFSLPPGGMIKKTGKTCEHCGFPMLIRLMKGKRPWTFCFNPECPSRKQREED